MLTPAVAPFNRGFAPTELPDDRHHVHSSTMVADQMALHEALNGDGNAVLIAHDWGAVGAWGAAGKEPGRRRRVVILNIGVPGRVAEATRAGALRRAGEAGTRSVRSNGLPPAVSRTADR